MDSLVIAMKYKSRIEKKIVMTLNKIIIYFALHNKILFVRKGNAIRYYIK